MESSTIESRLSEEEKKLLPSEDDILLFEKNGWFITDKILPDELIAEAVKGAERFYQGERDFNHLSTEWVADSAADSDAPLRNNEFVTLRNRELQKLGFYPLISAIAARLARTKEIRLFADSLIDKQPVRNNDPGAIGWHKDKAYWPTCTSDKLLTVWIPLQDCTRDMGPVVHIDGSHLWEDNEDLKSLYSFGDAKINAFEAYINTHKQGHKKTPVVLKKGQVSFHNCHTVHGSFANVSDRSRMALAVHLQDGDNAYQKAFKPDGELIKIGYDHMCTQDENGLPDYSDPNMFPVLWSEK